MDRATLLGILVGAAALFGAQAIEGGRLEALLQPTAALIVLGGTAGATLLATPGTELRRGIAMLAWLFRPSGEDPQAIARRLIAMSQTARKEGIIALEAAAERDPHSFVRLAIQHVVDGTNGPALREILGIDLDVRIQRELAGARIWEIAGGYAPTLGILGAVLGLIRVMENLSDPNALGTGIAVAFVATVYGVGAANLLLLPVAHKLERLVERRRTLHEMVIEGAVGIQGGQSPSAVADRLNAFLRETGPVGGELRASSG